MPAVEIFEVERGVHSKFAPLAVLIRHPAADAVNIVGAPSLRAFIPELFAIQMKKCAGVLKVSSESRLIEEGVGEAWVGSESQQVVLSR